MPISCRSTVANFSRITAAALVRPGLDLRRKAADDLLLAAAFHSHSPGVTSGSALCVFRMTDVRARAADNARKCDSAGPRSVEVGTHFYRPGAAEVQYCRPTYSQVSHSNPKIFNFYSSRATFLYDVSVIYIIIIKGNMSGWMFVCLLPMAGRTAGPIKIELGIGTHVDPESVLVKVKVKVIYLCVRYNRIRDRIHHRKFMSAPSGEQQ